MDCQHASGFGKQSASLSILVSFKAAFTSTTIPRISSVACLEFKTTQPNCYTLPLLVLFLVPRPPFCCHALTSRDRTRTEGKLRASALGKEEGGGGSRKDIVRDREESWRGKIAQDSFSHGMSGNVCTRTERL